LYKKIAQLDPTPSLSNAVEQFAMVDKTLREIRPGKESWNIKTRVTRL
jgi:hypothetical protein